MFWKTICTVSTFLFLTCYPAILTPVATCPLIWGRNQDVHNWVVPFQAQHYTALTTSMAAPHHHVWLLDSLLWPPAWHCIVGEVWEDINCSIGAASWSNWSSNCLFLSLICNTCSISWEIAEFCDATVVASISLVFCFSASWDWFVDKELFRTDFSALFLWLTAVLTLETESSIDLSSTWVCLHFRVGAQYLPPNINHQCQY